MLWRVTMKPTRYRALPIQNWRACVKNLKSLKQVFGSKSNLPLIKARTFLTTRRRVIVDCQTIRRSCSRYLVWRACACSATRCPACAAPHLPAIPSKKQDVMSATTTTNTMETDARSWHLVVQHRSTSLLATTADWVMGLISISPAPEDVALKFYNCHIKKLYPDLFKKISALSRYFYCCAKQILTFVDRRLNIWTDFLVRLDVPATMCKTVTILSEDIG